MKTYSTVFFLSKFVLTQGNGVVSGLQNFFDFYFFFLVPNLLLSLKAQTVMILLYY